MIVPQREKTYFPTSASNEDSNKKSDSDLSTWRKIVSLSIQKAPNEDSDQTAGMRAGEQSWITVTIKHRIKLKLLYDGLGPVVQSVVSLTTSLKVISLTVLADSIYNILILFAEKMWVAFALQKLLTFFQQNISAYLRITWSTVVYCGFIARMKVEAPIQWRCPSKPVTRGFMPDVISYIGSLWFCQWFSSTHYRLNWLSNTIYLQSPISILGSSGYEI